MSNVKKRAFVNLLKIIQISVIKSEIKAEICHRNPVI